MTDDDEIAKLEAALNVLKAKRAYQLMMEQQEREVPDYVYELIYGHPRPQPVHQNQHWVMPAQINWLDIPAYVQGFMKAAKEFNDMVEFAPVRLDREPMIFTDGNLDYISQGNRDIPNITTQMTLRFSYTIEQIDNSDQNDHTFTYVGNMDGFLDLHVEPIVFNVVDGQIPQEEIQHVLRQIVKDKRRKTKNHQAWYHVHYGWLDAEGIFVHQRQDVYPLEVIQIDRPEQKRTIRYNSDYQVYGLQMQYEIFQNVMKAKGDCKEFLFDVLGLDKKIITTESLLTREAIKDYVSRVCPEVYFVGQEYRPYDCHFHTRQVAMISQHIYVSQKGKQIIKSPKVISNLMQELTPVVTTRENLFERFLEFQKQGKQPYFTHDILLMDNQFIISEEQRTIFDLTQSYYNKRMQQFNFIKLFDQLASSHVELFNWKYQGILYSDDRLSSDSYHIDQISAYPNAFFSLPQVLSITQAIAVFKDQLLSEIDIGTSYAQISFKPTGDKFIDSITSSMNVWSQESLDLLTHIVLNRNYTMTCTVEYLYETAVCGNKASINKIQSKFIQYASEVHKPVMRNQINVLDYKILRNKCFGMMAGQNETQDMRIYDLDGAIPDFMQMYLKQTISENHQSNHKFIHCQMINKQFQRLFSGIDTKLICGIKTDSLFTVEPIEFDTTIFRIDHKTSMKIADMQPYPARGNVVIIQAQAGHGKTRYIQTTANKINDVVICVSCQTRDEYIKLNFHNVICYQWLSFTHQYDFLNNYKKLWIDEWCLVPAHMIYKLIEELHINVTLVGDINQNVNLNCTTPQYKSVMDHFGYKWLDTKGLPVRNSIDINKYLQTDNKKQSILADIKASNMILKGTDIDLTVVFNQPDLLIMAMDNNTVFAVNKLYQTMCIQGLIKEKQVIHKNWSKQLEPEYFNRQDTTDNHIYVNDKNHKVNDYYGCSRTIYAAQGLAAKNCYVILRGTESFEQLYVAYTRRIE